MAFCVHCGAQVTDNVAFCPNCGKPAGQPGAAAAAASQAAPDAVYAQPPQPQATYQAAPTASMPMEENVAGMLAYFTIVPAIIFLLIAPYNRNRFVRFHSFQCIFAAVAIVVINIALAIFSSILHFMPVIGWFVTGLMWPIWGLAILVLWLLLVIKAYQHQIFKLPFIGDMAEKQANA
jgi:uncharacterized membrane protein